jgi:hypothetical protein
LSGRAWDDVRVSASTDTDEPTPKPPTGRFCIFCGSKIDITAEHVWPEWLRQYLPTEGVAVPSWERENGRTGARFNQRPTPSGMPEEVIRRVCADCNNGWMADLESEMKPIFLQLYLLTTMTITPEMQEVIARWAFKTTAVYEWVRPGTVTISQDKREAFHETGELPPGTNVNISACNTGDLIAHHAFFRYPGSGLHYPAEVLGVANTTWTTLLAGRVAFSAFVFGGDEYLDATSVEADFAPLVHPTEPEGVAWPPARVFNDGPAYRQTVRAQLSRAMP